MIVPIKIPGTPIILASSIDVARLIIASATGTKRFSCKMPAAAMALLTGALMPLRKKFMTIAATVIFDINKSSPNQKRMK